jgi:hypothetical protein
MDIQNDLITAKRKEDVHKEAEKIAGEHGGSHGGASEHKEESHPEPKGGGDKGGHGH